MVTLRGIDDDGAMVCTGSGTTVVVLLEVKVLAKVVVDPKLSLPKSIRGLVKSAGSDTVLQTVARRLSLSLARAARNSVL
jgi:hypothetical protein